MDGRKRKRRKLKAHDADTTNNPRPMSNTAAYNAVTLLNPETIHVLRLDAEEVYDALLEGALEVWDGTHAYDALSYA
jgi:hypothetical protein